MTKQQADKILKGSRLFGIEIVIQGVNGKENDYKVKFFHQSDLSYENYLAARMFLMSLELEKGKPL
jgi:hypothetical protein